MSKRMSTDELKRHIEEAVGELNRLLNSWLDSTEDADQKRAQIMAYWVKTYTGMIRRESDFNPASIPRLTRRQIVNVDFGFRVGSELGGLHYAVVLDKKNSVNGDTVTVVPLGSMKEHYKANRNRVILEDGIYNVLSEKVEQQLAEVRSIVDSVSNDKDLQALDPVARTNEAMHRFATAKSKLDNADASVKKMYKLKQGSVANVSQLTTVSKIRIKEPTTPQSVLYGVKVSERDMEKIEKALIELYISKGTMKEIL